jgi:hypothetical protein
MTERLGIVYGAAVLGGHELRLLSEADGRE